MSDTAIAAAPIVAAAQPYITAIVTSLVGVGVTYGLAALKRWTGIAFQQSMIDEIESAAETEAAKAVAAASDNLAKTQSMLARRSSGPRSRASSPARH